MNAEKVSPPDTAKPPPLASRVQAVLQKSRFDPAAFLAEVCRALAARGVK